MSGLRKRMLNIGGLAFDQSLMLDFGARKNKRALMAIGYELLWAIAEDSGCFKGDLQGIAKHSGFFELSVRDVSELLRILENRKNILSYFPRTEEKCYWLTNFHNHQVLHNPSAPKISLPPWLTYETKKHQSGKMFAAYYLIRSNLPPEARNLTSKLPELSEEDAGKLLVTSRSRSGSRSGSERELESKSGGPDNGNGSGASGAPSSVKDSGTPTEEQMREIAQLCDSLMLCFGIPPTYNPVINEESWRRKFHPFRFVQTTFSQDVPAEVTLKVLRSMDRQKEDIQNPYAWLVTVMGNEWSQYNYELEIKAHEERKKGLRDVAGILRRII